MTMLVIFSLDTDFESSMTPAPYVLPCNGLETRRQTKYLSRCQESVSHPNQHRITCLQRREMVFPYMGLVAAFPHQPYSYPAGLSASLGVALWTLSQMLAIAPVAQPAPEPPAVQTQTFLAPRFSASGAAVVPQQKCIASQQQTFLPTSLPPPVDRVSAVLVVELVSLAVLVFPVLVVVVRVPR